MWTARFYHNPASDWLLALTTAVFVFLLVHTGLVLLRRRLHPVEEPAEIQWRAIVPVLLARIHPLVLFLISVYFGAKWLELPETAGSFVGKGALLALLFQCARMGSAGIHFWTHRYRRQKLETDAAVVTTISALGLGMRILIWAVLLLIALDNLGINVTTLLAGLGIGGIAVALAAQNILGDLFASFSIVLDKPFVIGDFIIVDTFLGTVEHIGLKTTRIRSLSGEMLIFSNADLLKSRIRNYKQMEERRVVFSFGVTYQTPIEKIEAIPEIIRTIVGSQQPVRFDRAHFKGYGAYALDFEAVYWIGSPDYTLYMDIQQAINIALFRRFDQEGIEFAYPTQTLYFKNQTGGSP